MDNCITKLAHNHTLPTFIKIFLQLFMSYHNSMQYFFIMFALENVGFLLQLVSLTLDSSWLSVQLSYAESQIRVYSIGIVTLME